MTGGLSHTLHEGSGKMTGLMVETPHSLGSASTELRSRVEALGDASGDAAGTTYLLLLPYSFELRCECNENTCTCWLRSD